ncbi:MAG: autotransporter outer membrane beta-barrel domain-containing protein [Acidaminococcus sp.]|nr:autotransporter outer membrane beta-barrel domain-containing protein [Acidaminococcus sp.]
MTAPNTNGYYSTPVPVWVTDGNQVYLEATTGNVTVGKPLSDGGCKWGAYVDSRGTNSVLTKLTIDAKQDVIVMGEGIHHFGISAYNNAETKVIAGGNTEMYGGYSTIYACDADGENATGNTLLTVTSEGSNNIYAADDTSKNYGAGCVSANNGAEIQIEAKNGDNNFIATGNRYKLCAIDSNVIYQTGYGTPVKQSLVEVTADKGSNHVSHPYMGMRARIWGKIDFTAYQDNTVTTTLPNYTMGVDSRGNGAEIQLTSQHGNNEVTADYAVIGAYGGTVTFDAPGGTTKITGTTAGILSSAGGTVTVNDASDISGSTVLQAESYQQDSTGANVGDPASITVNYAGDSKITGDAMQAYNNGTITIAPSEDSAKETIVSDVVAFGTNDAAVEYVGGTVDIQLTNGSSLTGQTAVADNVTEDYGTVRGGTINLDLPSGSNWYMTGSSSVTNLSGDGGTVHFQNGGHSLQITNQLSGSHTFVLDLSKDGSQSDMIYMRQGTSDEQTLNIRNLQELSDSMEEGDAVRFAVVSESQNEFRDGKVYTADGINNKALKVEYRDVATDPLNTDAYNDAYNGDGTNKPTTAQVKAFYIDPFEDPQYVYLVLPETEEEQEPVVNDGAKSPGNFEGLLWRYVTDIDTFTKRDGQSLYFTPGADQGGWIRLGYRNFGVDGVGELDGNSYELGYTDVTKQTDEAKHRLSLSAAYSDPSGRWEGLDGDIDLEDFTVALYDTHEYYPSAEKRAAMPEWKQDSHAYWDNYLKYHHVRSDYSVRDRQTDTRYAGDFSRDVWNLSTEYGHRLYLDKGWFWVPQVQLQLSYVGGYDYYDSQDLHVDADHDWSLIGRLGFDLVRELDPKLDSKLYFKASVLHEFLDGSDVTVGANGEYYTDDGDYSGTWGVVGLGYSAKIGEQQYMYLDAERYFGNDFSRTYGIRAGVNWKF